MPMGKALRRTHERPAFRLLTELKRHQGAGNGCSLRGTEHVSKSGRDLTRARGVVLEVIEPELQIIGRHDTPSWLVHGQQCARRLRAGSGGIRADCGSVHGQAWSVTGPPGPLVLRLWPACDNCP